MKLKTFFSKNMREDVRGQLWIPSLIGFSLFMLQTVLVMVSFENWEQRQYRLTRIHQLCENLWREDMVNLPGFVAAAAGIICGLYAFLYLHSSRKVDFYHSLPTGRETLFIKRVMTHLKHYLIPSAVVTFLSICACALQGEFSLKILGYGVGTWIFQVLIFLMSYGVTVLAVVLTGTPLLAALGTIVFHVYGAALSVLILEYMRVFFNTFYSSNYDISPALWPTPLGGGLYSAEQMLLHRNFKPVLVYLLVIFLVWCVSFVLYKKRPSESAGHSMAFPKIGIVIKYILQIPMILGIGVIIQSMVNNSEHKEIWWTFGLAVGAIFSHVVMETLYSMNFRSFMANKRHFVCICMLAAVFTAVFHFDLIGYDTWYPKPEKLDKLSLNLRSLSSEYGYSLSEIGLRYGEALWSEEGERGYISFSAESPLYAVLQKIVKNQDAESIEDKSVILVNYRLGSGKEEGRRYFINEQDAVNIMEAICMEPEYLEYKWPDYEKKKELLEKVWFDTSYEYQDISFRGDKKLAFYEAFRKDVEQAELSDYMEYPVGRILFDYQYKIDIEPEFTYDTDSITLNATDSFYIFPGFENTLELMEKEGISLELQAEDIQEIKLLDMTESRENPEETVYAEKEDIEELLPSLKPQEIWCAWLPYTYDYQAVLEMKGEENDWELAMYLDPNNLPTNLIQEQKTSP